MIEINNILVLRLLNLILTFTSIRWDASSIGKGSKISCPFKIGKGTWISDNFCAKGYGEIQIGKYSAIGSNIKIITSDHDTSYPTMNFILQNRITGKHFPAKIQDVIIGHDVWIGDNVILLAGVEIGNGAVIGAGSIVTKSVGNYEIHAGVPAKFIRYRFEEDLIQSMLDIAWWNWSDSIMADNKEFFSLPVSKKSIDAIRRKTG